MPTNGSPSDTHTLTREQRVAQACAEIQEARATGQPVHRYRFALWGQALGVGVDQAIALTGLVPVDYGPRVSAEQWAALEKAKQVLAETQQRREERVQRMPSGT